MIYFILNTRRKAIKIGYSAQPRSRLSGLQTSSPDHLTILGVCPGEVCDEKALHSRFEHIHIRGEWFKDCAELTEAVKVLCAGYRFFGRCQKCGETARSLHEDVLGGMVCDDCTRLSTLRRSRHNSDRDGRTAAGGGYRIVRKSVMSD